MFEVCHGVLHGEIVVERTCAVERAHFVRDFFELRSIDARRKDALVQSARS